MSDPSGAEAPKRTRRRLPFGVQFSLAELLLVALFACVGVAAAKTGGLLAWLFAEATIVLAVAFVVAAIFARKTTQAFAIGFVLGVAAHGLCLFFVGASEFDPETARLPFSRMAAPIWTAMEPEAYVSLSTGEDVPVGDVLTTWTSDASGQMRSFVHLADGSGVEKVERPTRADFMLVAHTLGAAAAGYLMGKLAAILYRRHERTGAETGPSS